MATRPDSANGHPATWLTPVFKLNTKPLLMFETSTASTSTCRRSPARYSRKTFLPGLTRHLKRRRSGLVVIKRAPRCCSGMRASIVKLLGLQLVSTGHPDGRAIITWRQERKAPPPEDWAAATWLARPREVLSGVGVRRFTRVDSLARGKVL